MREILFRGKRKDNGDWVYGDLIHNIDCVKVRERETDINRIAKSYEVIPETVCQYTGLKDINGKEIWEGDKGVDEQGNTGHVKYTIDGFAFVYDVPLYDDWESTSLICLWDDEKCCIEVTGNRYDKEEE